MYKARLLKVINDEAIPNLVHINRDKLKLDIDNKDNYLKHIVPYFVSTTGLAVNTKYIPEGYNSWSVLWDKHTSF